MKEITGRYTKALIGDNIEIMEQYILEDFIFDLCLTDPPYNLSTELCNKQKEDYIRNTGKTFEDKKIRYTDTIENYEEFSKKWFESTKKISKMQIFTFGTKNLKMWLNIEEPKALIYIYKPNGFGRTCYFHFNRIEPALIYGDVPTTLPFLSNVIKSILKNGFMRPDWEKKLVHPHPKPIEFYLEVLERLKPKCIIDPFVGSGTVLEACETLKIKAIGIEINEVYANDIKLRIENGIKSSSIYNINSKVKKLGEY